MNRYRRATHILFMHLLVTLFLSTPAIAASTLVDLSAEASIAARNDLVFATLSAESSGATPGEVARQVNSLIADALKIARKFDTVKTQNAGTSTYPVYSKNGKIEMWRMRSELLLESVDMEALAELLGKLQITLGITNLNMGPAPGTRKKAENEAMLAALVAFRSRAALLADAMGKPYTIKQISINTSGRFAQPVFRATSKTMLAEAAPMPIDAGEAMITVTVSGQIELAP